MNRLRLGRDCVASGLDQLKRQMPAVRAKHGASSTRVKRLENMIEAVDCVLEAIDQLIPAAARGRYH
jgi:hypothetical protein